MSASRLRAQARSVGLPPRASHIWTAMLPSASAPQTASISPSGNGLSRKRPASMMVIAWPTTAPQRSRTIQPRLIRAADSTVMGAEQPVADRERDVEIGAVHLPRIVMLLVVQPQAPAEAEVVAEVQPLVQQVVGHRGDDEERGDVGAGDRAEHEADRQREESEEEDQQDRRKEHHLEVAGGLELHRVVGEEVVVHQRVALEDELEKAAPVVHRAAVREPLDE